MRWTPEEAERLAALLDGGSGADRDELLARLAGDDELRAVFADAAAVTAELEAEDAGVVPLRPRGSARRWVAAAAVVAALAAGPAVWRLVRGPAGELAPGEAVALLALPGGGLPAAWEGQPWEATRAEGDPMSERARGVRLGARLVDLTLASRTPAGADAARAAARDAASLVRDVPGGRAAATTLGALAAGVPGPDDVDAAVEHAAGLVAADDVGDGAWLEAARVAAARRDGAFFTAGESGRRMERLGKDPAAAEGIRALRAALAGAAPDWPAADAALRRLLAGLGG